MEKGLRNFSHGRPFSPSQKAETAVATGATGKTRHTAHFSFPYILASQNITWCFWGMDKGLRNSSHGKPLPSSQKAGIAVGRCYGKNAPCRVSSFFAILADHTSLGGSGGWRRDSPHGKSFPPLQKAEIAVTAGCHGKMLCAAHLSFPYILASQNITWRLEDKGPHTSGRFCHCKKRRLPLWRDAMGKTCRIAHFSFPPYKQVKTSPGGKGSHTASRFCHCKKLRLPLWRDAMGKTCRIAHFSFPPYKQVKTSPGGKGSHTASRFCHCKKLRLPLRRNAIGKNAPHRAFLFSDILAGIYLLTV